MHEYSLTQTLVEQDARGRAVNGRNLSQLAKTLPCARVQNTFGLGLLLLVSFGGEAT